MKTIDIRISIEDESLIPTYSTPAASGADTFAAINEPITLKSGQSTLIPTGLKVEIPEGFEIQVRPRSGLAFKNQITVLNTPGTIDADYRGEIGIILINHGKEEFTVTPKMRIAQLVVCPIVQANFTTTTAELATSSRGEGGFGHTGL
jgi:dUTP pyrophosphatase